MKVGRRGVVRLSAPADWPKLAAEECAVEDESEEAPSIAAAAALVGGTTVGAGILALPRSTIAAGVVPGCAVIAASWVFMVAAALLVAETTTSAICATKRPGLGLLTTSAETLGPRVGAVAGAAYAFIHYALLVAYIAQGGVLLVDAFGLPRASGGAIFVATFGAAVAFGPARLVERLNSALVLVVGASFAVIVGLALPEIDASRLAATDDWGNAFQAIPICVLALVFHNVVPVLVTRFKGDKAALTKVIVLGSAAPALMFVVWTVLVCAAVDPPADLAAFDPVDALRAGGADDKLAAAVALFSLTALATSFFGFYYGLRSYLCDLFDITDDPLSDDVRPPPEVDLALAAAIFAPPLVIATIAPDVFLPALDVAGTFGITTLFGIIPAATAWRQRRQPDAPSVEPYVPGGDLTLAIIIGLASTVILEGALDKLRLFL